MKGRDVKKVAVFGAGAMGPGLALVFAVAGHDVTLYSQTVEMLNRALTTARASLQTMVRHGALKEATADSAFARIRPTQNLLEAGERADFVVETITESKEAKTVLYEELDAVCPDKAVFASNTSALNIFELMPTARLPRTLVTHYFMPTHIIPLVEVLPGPQTSSEALESTIELLESCGKNPLIIKKFGSGFIVNRIQRAIGETAMDIIAEGLADPEEIDRAIKMTLGVRLPIAGVMQTLDFQGLDMLLAYQRKVGKVHSFVEERVERGELGVKTARGIYDYEGRSEVEILAKRDELYLGMLDHLKEIGAFAPI